MKPPDFISLGIDGRGQAVPGFVAACPASEAPALGYLKVCAEASRSAKAAPLVFLCGGPGDSATSQFRGWEEWALAHCAFRDVYFLDQRFVGQSFPSLVPPIRRNWSLSDPIDRSEYLNLTAAEYREARDWYERMGLSPGALSLRAACDDIVRFADHIGAETVDLIGMSFGSHHAISVMRYSPERVRKAIIGLVEGPDDTVKLPSLMDAHIRRVCSMAADPRHTSTPVDALFERIESQIASLDRSLPSVSLDPDTQVRLSGDDLRRWLGDCLGVRDTIASLPRTIASLENGDASVIARHALKQRQEGLENVVSYAFDAAANASKERQRQIASEWQDSIVFDYPNLPLPYAAEEIGVADAGDQHRSDLSTEIPILAFSADLDGQTPRSNALALEASCPNFCHLDIHGLSHSYFSHSELTQRQIAFLDDREIDRSPIRSPFSFDPVV